MRNILIEECRSKHLLDPRELDVRGSHMVELSMTVDEIRRFLIATAVNTDEIKPRT